MSIPAMYEPAKIRAYCESLGLTEVRRLLKVENHFHMADRHVVEAWVPVKEAELRDESVSIARKALANSLSARRIAITAMVLSTLTAIAIAVTNHFAK